MDERMLGRLEAQVENLTRTLEQTNEEAVKHREGIRLELHRTNEEAAHSRETIRGELSQLSERVGSLNTSLNDLGRKVISQGNVLKGFEDRRLEFRGMLRGGKWVARTGWLGLSAVLVIWGEHIKYPFVKLLELFNIK